MAVPAKVGTAIFASDGAPRATLARMFDSLLLALLSIPVIAVVSLVLSLRTRTRLKQIEQKLDTLQRWLADRADLEPSAEAPPEALPAPAAAPAEEKIEADEPVGPVPEPVPQPPAPL